LLAFVTYIVSLRLIYLDQKHMSVGDSVPRELAADEGTSAAAVAGSLSLRHATIGYLATTLVILIAASYLAPVADELARVTNLGGTFIGSTLVALTTSLPEVVTSAAAVRMGAFDLAVGNVLGSNAFNMAILLPVDMLYRSGSLLQDAELANGITGVAVILVTGILTLGLLYRPQKRYWLIEPDAALVVLLAGAAFAALYYLVPQAP
jgi:cation:H+ antiporter